MPRKSKQGGVTYELDTVLTILGNERRRLTLRYACVHGDATTKELTSHIASIETGKDPHQTTSDERQRVYTTLYQNHLPKMDDAGFITYEDHVVTPENWTHDLWDVLDELETIVNNSVESAPEQQRGLGLPDKLHTLPGGDHA